MKRLLAAVLLLSSCTRAPSPEAASRPAAASAALFVGDSLTAGYGVDPEDAWPALVEREWERRALPWRARNAAVSGSTSAGALEAVKWALTPDVKLVFVCIGGNDGLRGTPLTTTRKNVSALLAELKKDRRTVVLAGMRIPPNYGKDYADGFAALFPSLAKQHGVAFMPFLLDGVAAVPSLNLPDGIHPNEEGHKKLAASVLAFLDKEGLPR